MERFIFGIDIGGTAIKCGLFTAEGILKEKWELPTDRTNAGENVPGDIAAAIDAKCRELGIAKEQIAGIGLGVPGPVKEDGFVSHCPNLGWREMNVNEVMSRLTGVPAVAANDANVAALGEMWKGGGAGVKNMVLVTLGTGVGGGVIVEGRIVAGAFGAGGELGHMVMNPQETVQCGCGGYGHLEQYASATGIVRMAKKRLAETTDSSVLRSKETLTAKDIFDAAKDNDAVAAELVEELGEVLGRALSHVAAVTDPEVFVIGGGVSKAGKILTETVERHYNKGIMKALEGKEFRLATLGNDAGIYGCARLILDRTEK
ncbi:MAG: ROK family glucokinase [Lachnospiraceae bacterium]|nr:ROK family glucokinase [Lachnospiraceae bacterium]